MLRKISAFWLRNVNSRIAPLVVTIGSVGLTSCLVVLLALSKLFDEVLERESFAFDTSFLLWLHQFANPSLDVVMLTITRLGDPEIVLSIAAVSLGILWWQHYRQEAKILAIACLGAAILSTGLKLFFNKPRPELWHRLISETSFGFPSGHALGSVVFYGLLAYLLATHYPKSSKVIYTFAVGVIVAISLSRLYLGVHWPTDVIAGGCIGFLWLMLSITMLKLQKLK